MYKSLRPIQHTCRPLFGTASCTHLRSHLRLPLRPHSEWPPCTPTCTQTGPGQPSERLAENHQLALSPALLCRLVEPSLRPSERSLCLRPRLEPSLRGLQDDRRILEHIRSPGRYVAAGFPFVASAKPTGQPVHEPPKTWLAKSSSGQPSTPLEHLTEHPLASIGARAPSRGDPRYCIRCSSIHHATLTAQL